ncbi:membrane protein insertion efficiency factor YidD [Candidatus Curtissbacteria bacterium RIFCSPHIGHO2_12_FULL_38_9b]|uniref:Membrane protein insertion efficiency factor YidD n=1 Tax=Candidatus Curtissbacteria bacterium RIFCSPHIGHO2_12_FULL_38_9b TaxID=1797720 RepID=A0A1F5GX59_9BACT|nr:MAG: membrane protein insertion efficiency factor YidD [Candidatus Curtissbacteria bacterium RIFCSPHIGHO2_12_FULL_38_9b]
MIIVKFVFVIYHKIFKSPVATCRYRPTCSEYALEAYGKYGFLKGSLLTVRRLVSCHPFSKKPLYDPV